MEVAFHFQCRRLVPPALSRSARLHQRQWPRLEYQAWPLLRCPALGFWPGRPRLAGPPHSPWGGGPAKVAPARRESGIASLASGFLPPPPPAGGNGGKVVAGGTGGKRPGSNASPPVARLWLCHGACGPASVPAARVAFSQGRIRAALISFSGGVGLAPAPVQWPVAPFTRPTKVRTRSTLAFVARCSH
jgi:hypothetical protein